MHRILIVEDRISVRAMMADYLKQEFEVVTANDGQEALNYANQSVFDCILLDIMMPGMDGIEFLKQLRLTSNTSVMVISARLDEADKIQALELGADEYVTKPISMREVSARVKAMIRRASREFSVEFNPAVRMEERRRSIIINHQEFSLTPTEYKILDVLYQNENEVISRETISQALYNSDPSKPEPDRIRAIDVHIRNIRCKIEQNPDDPKYILTVYGLGYRFKTT